MHSIYSLCPAPWGDAYRFVEMFDTEDDAKAVLASLEKVNILFNYYKIVEEDYVGTNKQLRAEVKRQKIQLEEAAHEIEELRSLIDAMKEGR